MGFLYRGAVVKAMAICTRHSFLHIYKVAKQSGEITAMNQLTASIASIIASSGRVFQITISRDTGSVIRCC